MTNKAIAISVCLLLLAFPACSDEKAPRSQPPDRPNLVVIITDDQRARGTMHVMPNTRRLFASQGTNFVNAFATTPYCCPSRASIFTGRYVHNHNVLTRIKYYEKDFDQSSTVQSHLQEAGYKTAIFGKYLNGWDLDRRPPHFDEWAIFGLSKYAAYGTSGRERRGPGSWNIDGERKHLGQYTTTYLQRRAVDFVTRASRQQQPWALFVSTGAPHSPYIPEPKYRSARVGRFGKPASYNEADMSDKPALLESMVDASPRAGLVRRRQLRTLMSVDDLVGELYETLDVLGEDEHTVSFFLSDNGHTWGEHGLLRKLLPYPEATRIPLLMRWPGRVPGGRTDSRLIANIDIAPTIYAALGIRSHGFVDGRSLLDPTWRRSRLLLEFWADQGVPSWTSLLTHRFQYTEYRARDGFVQATEYYDMTHDPAQMNNLLGDGTTRGDPRLGPIRRRLKQAVRCKGSRCP